MFRSKLPSAVIHPSQPPYNVATHFMQKEIDMLITTRRPGDSIVIQTPSGDQNKVTVLDLKAIQMHIGTQAPAEVQILREELYESATT